MKKRNQLLRYNMQFFADKGGDGDGADKTGDGDDNQDDDQDDKSSDDKAKKSDKATKGKTYTQEEIDEMITERLKRERKKAEKKQEQVKDDKQGGKGADDKSKATDDKVSALEAKLLCFEHDVAKESVSDVVALAKAYVDEDTDFEAAIKKVIKKYPQFVKGSTTKKNNSDDDDTEDEDEDDTDNKGAWGQRQKGQSKKVDGVEAAFLRKNPGLKID